MCFQTVGQSMIMICINFSAMLVSKYQLIKFRLEAQHWFDLWLRSRWLVVQAKHQLGVLTHEKYPNIVLLKTFATFQFTFCIAILTPYSQVFSANSKLTIWNANIHISQIKDFHTSSLKLGNTFICIWVISAVTIFPYWFKLYVKL